MRVFHGTTTFLVFVLPDANSKRGFRSWMRLAGRVVVLTLGNAERGVLFSELLQRCLGVCFRAAHEIGRIWTLVEM